jgi:hypothetical protein
MISKPKPGEYAPFSAKYIALIDEEGDILAILESLKKSTYDLFNNISADKADYAYADGKWTLKEVLGHMIDAERTFAYRAFCFSRGQKELPGFDQDQYVMNATFRSRSLKDLANEFRTTRESNLYLFRSITPEQQLKTGLVDGNTVSVRAFIYITAGHELHHLNIIKKFYLS